MNHLRGTRVYLAGPVDHDPNCASWRDNITKTLEKMGVIVYNPLVKPKWMNEKGKVNPNSYFNALYGGDDGCIQSPSDTFEGMRYVRKLCMAQVSHSDWMICYLPKKTFTFGTIVELDRFDIMNKPVLFVSPGGIPSSWALSQFSNENDWNDTFFDDWDDLLNHIQKIDNGEVLEKLDPYKWFYVRYKYGF